VLGMCQRLFGEMFCGLMETCWKILEMWKQISVTTREERHHPEHLRQPEVRQLRIGVWGLVLKMYRGLF